MKLKTTYADFSSACNPLEDTIDKLTEINYLDISNQIGTVKVYIDITYASDDSEKDGLINGTNLETGEVVCALATNRTNPITRLIQDQPSGLDQSD